MTIQLSTKGAVATVTINRPEKLNALSHRMIDQLSSILDQLEADDAVRAIVLTGAGRHAFSAGADIGDLAGSIAGGVDQALREIVRRGQGLTRRIETFPKPIIVAVNGLAYGAGCEITEAAPLAIASQDATFAKPEITLGFPPPFGGSQRLPRHVGRKRGLEMILTGDPIGAARAAELGIVNTVVAPERLLEAASELAGRIIRHAASAVTACLAAVTRGINVPIDEGLAVEGVRRQRGRAAGSDGGVGRPCHAQDRAGAIGTDQPGG
jgi:enoyl-CoA hydratase/carnithine racemase